jgi:hypothetical protein
LKFSRNEFRAFHKTNGRFRDSGKELTGMDRKNRNDELGMMNAE